MGPEHRKEESTPWVFFLHVKYVIADQSSSLRRGIAHPTFDDLVGKVRFNDNCQYMTVCFTKT